MDLESVVPVEQERQEDVIGEVVPGLYIGSLRSLRYLKELGITHVLSVINFEISPIPSYTHLRLPLRDDEGANLLAHLPAAYAFIHSGITGTPMPSAQLEGEQEEEEDDNADGTGAVAPSAPLAPGRVLVHCQAGQSRSAAVVIAYLMKSRGMDDIEALSLLRSRWPTADPNEGFMAQLGLFADMRCSLDTDHPVFKLWSLQQVGRRYEEEGWVDPNAFATTPQDKQGSSSALYRCRKCRRLLASGRNVMPVDEVAAGHRIFRIRKSQRLKAAEPQGKQAGADEGTSLFLEPMDWMVGAVVGAVQGKLYCPGCGARLGSFNWAGITNETGRWITPAFQVHAARLDAVHPSRPLADMALMRTPRIGPAAGGSRAVGQGGQAAAGGTGDGHAGDVSQAQPTLDPGQTMVLQPQAQPQQLQQPTGDGDGDGVGPSHTRKQQQHSVNGSTTPQESLSVTQHDLRTVLDNSHAEAASATSAREGAARAAIATSSEIAGIGSDGARVCHTAWFTTLVLDCDGVMVDSERPSCEALRRAILQVTDFDIPHSFPEDYYEVFGRDVYGCLEHYKAKFSRSDWGDLDGLARRVVEAKEDIYKQLTTEMGIRAFPGAASLIAEARRLGMSVGIGSSGAPAKIQHNLTACGLQGLVDQDQIVSAAYVNRGKPAPDVYIECLRRLRCSDPSRALVVEDAINGLKAAAGAGAFAVAVSTSLPADRLRPWAGLVLRDVAELVERLATLTPNSATEDARPQDEGPRWSVIQPLEGQRSGQSTVWSHQIAHQSEAI